MVRGAPVIAGMSGSLLSHDAVDRLIDAGLEATLQPARWVAVHKRLRAWHAEVQRTLGPTAGPRQVFDLVAGPLAVTLGFGVRTVAGSGRSGIPTVDAELTSEGRAVAVLVAGGWGHSLRGLWRQAVHRGLAHGTRWALCVNGPAMCVFDVERSYARRSVEFELASVVASERAVTVLCALAGASGLCAGASTEPTLSRVVAFSEQHRAGVRVSLRTGVLRAVIDLIAAFQVAFRGRRARAASQILEESLTVVYRLLFLLFAEARGLVPLWHPVYRDSYSMAELRHRLRQGDVRGLWEALQAVARLAHRGCAAGTLNVAPFNGRLFSPTHAPLADSARLDDRTVASAMRSLTTRQVKAVRGAVERTEEIAYADLGVEQLGGVYEHLLDFDAVTGADGNAVLVPTGRRKATGSFYTPRSLTAFVVRRALGPVVEGRTPEEILALRILDPAMGSGAFLVAACRSLASAYEAALIRSGEVPAERVTEADRADFRRAIAQRCLYGVDVNPMAVQLGRLSLWLATLAAEKPLSFLDHRLRVGNSLIGASIDDLRREPATRAPRLYDLPLFPEAEAQLTLRSAVETRQTLAEVADDSIEQVRAKERHLAELEREDGPLRKWRTAADIWCAAHLLEPALARGVFGDLRDSIVRGGAGSGLPRHVSAPIFRTACAAAREARVFHWTMEFPEVFYDRHGSALPDGGFDVVLGNPPWEMLRGGGPDRHGLVAYAKRSGQYRLQGDGHTNLYQLFFERSVRLLRSTGRCGLIVPAGFGSDHGSSSLRRFLLDRTLIDTFTIVDNADGVFPIHRGLKFLLLTFAAGARSGSIPVRCGIRAVAALERVADSGPDAGALNVPRALIERLSGESLAVPELRTEDDLRIVVRVSSVVPWLSDPESWGLHFGRELNATDDRPHFNQDGNGLPIVEGKQLQAFRVDPGGARYWVAADKAAVLLPPEQTFRRARLAYRDVAAAGNRMTLIAAVVPRGVVTTHTVFCLKEDLDEEAQAFVCGVLNSYVANYFVRMRVGIHVTSAIVSRLPVPRPARSDPRFAQVVRCARRLADGEATDVLAELNAAVASLYGLDAAAFAHVLGTFPLVAAAERSAALRWYHALRFDTCVT